MKFQPVSGFSALPHWQENVVTHRCEKFWLSRDRATVRTYVHTSVRPPLYISQTEVCYPSCAATRVFVAGKKINAEDNKGRNSQSFEICPEMHANKIHALYDRHQKVYPSPDPHHKASNSAIHKDIWKLQLIMCYTQGLRYVHFWT